MTITFVGAGNLASHLAPALAAAGHDIVCVFSHTMKSANALAERIGQGSRATNVLDEISEADAYFISVKDDALADVVAAWPKHCKRGVVVHTAGTMAMDVISSTSDHTGVLYPMQTFSKEKTLNFKEIHCFIEGNCQESENVVKLLADSVSDHVTKLSSKDRKYLHIAAVFACNFTNHMYALAFEILEQRGIEPNCLISLIDETARKTHHLHPHNGQTGPARRGDEKVMQEHLNVLKDNGELHEIYKMMSKSILNRFPR